MIRSEVGTMVNVVWSCGYKLRDFLGWKVLKMPFRYHQNKHHASPVCFERRVSITLNRCHHKSCADRLSKRRSLGFNGIEEQDENTPKVVALEELGKESCYTFVLSLLL
jgi:hypothetical protein